MKAKIQQNGNVIRAYHDAFDLVQRVQTGQLWMYDEYTLTREDVVELLPILQRFAETGSIEEPNESEAAT